MDGVNGTALRERKSKNQLYVKLECMSTEIGIRNDLAKAPQIRIIPIVSDLQNAKNKSVHSPSSILPHFPDYQSETKQSVLYFRHFNLHLIQKTKLLYSEKNTLAIIT